MSFSILKALLINCLFFLTALAQAQTVDPEIKWRILETPNFQILYDSKHYNLAEIYARAAEHAYLVTQPFFREAPEKTFIVLSDNSDLANGFASGVPYPLVGAFPVLPAATESISDYGDWAYELLVHEFTHVLSFQPARGVARPLRYGFGSIIRPNMFLPRWWLEGVAVQQETRLTPFGRLRSPNFMAIPRAMIEDDVLRKEDIARINEVTIPDWPGGIRPYLMGALLFNEMVRLRGDEAIYELTDRYSRRFPYFINGPARSLFNDLGYQELLDRVYKNLEQVVNLQKGEILKEGAQKETLVAQEGFFSHTPQISPNGEKMIFVGRTHNKDGLIQILERDSNGQFVEGSAKVAVEASFAQRASWLPNSRQFVFDALDVFDRHYFFADLYIYDLDTKKKKQLTFGARAHDPAVSPDGKRIAFVQNVPGGTRLAICNIEGKGISVLYEPALQVRVSRPEWLNDQEVLFVERALDGTEMIQSLSLQTKKTVVAENWRAMQPLHFPRVTKAGIFFIGDGSGLANAYFAKGFNQPARPVTNTTTRVLTVELDSKNDDLYISRLRGDGLRLHKVAKGEWQKSISAAKVPPLLGDFSKSPPRPNVDIPLENREYWALPHMYPRYWFPYIYFAEDGTIVSASTSGMDPLKKHVYTLSAAYDGSTKRPSFAGTLFDQSLPVPQFLQVADFYERILGSTRRRHQTEIDYFAAGTFYKMPDEWTWQLGWRYWQTELASSVVRQGPQVGLQYMNISQRGLEISPEKGGSASLQHVHYIGSLGAVDFSQTDFAGSFFFSKWLPKRNALAGFLSATYAPKLDDVELGRTTVGGNYFTAGPRRAALLRGYPSGAFYARNLLQATLEYRFPLSYVYSGFGTSPFFLQRWHAAAVVDAMTLDGIYYDKDQNYRATSFGKKSFVGVGAEVRADWTMFYHFMVTTIFGGYYGLEEGVYGSRAITPFIGLGIAQ